MHRRSGSGGGNYSGGRYGGYGSSSSGMYERELMDEMAFRREMMQRGMMGDMGFYGGMGMNPMNMGMSGMMMGNMSGSSNSGGGMGNMGGGMNRQRGDRGNRDRNKQQQQRGNQGNQGGQQRGNQQRGGNQQQQGNRGMNQGGNQGNRGGNQGNRGGNQGNRGGNQGNMQQQRQGQGMQRNRSDPGQGTHQRRLSDMRQDRDQTRRRDRDQQQWDRRGGPQNLVVKESGPLGKIKAISHRIKEWGNFAHGLPYWTKRANIFRRFSNFLERGNLDHTIVFIGHGSDCVCRLYVDELYLAEGCGASKSEARSDAYYRAVERLRLRNFDAVINKDDKFTTNSLKGYEVDQVIAESPSNQITFESNYAQVATSRVADFNYPWDKLILVERAGMANAGLKLRLSANLNGMLLEQNTSKAVPPGETKPKWKFAISLENKLLGEAYHDKQGIARSNACIDAMKKLDPCCWRLVVDRHRFPKLKTQRGGDRRNQNKKDDTKTPEKKTDETKEDETKKEDDLDASVVKEEDEEESQEDSDEPFVPPVADLKRSDLVDPEEITKDEKEEEEEEKEEEKEEKEEETEKKEGEDKEEPMDDDAKEEDAAKKEASKLEQRLKQKIESDAKQRKKAEFLHKIRKALEEKLTQFAAKRNYGQLVLEGFWMEERDHVIRLCRKHKMRSYVDKYRTDEGKIIHFIFVSQIIPMEEMVTALKKAKGMKIGCYNLLKPKTKAEIEAEEAEREAERVKREEARIAQQKERESKRGAKKETPVKTEKEEEKESPMEETPKEESPKKESPKKETPKKETPTKKGGKK